MQLGKDGGAATVILRNQLTFWSSQFVKKAILSTIQADLSCISFFYEVL